ncbi:metallophosphoesterase family protein, partial [Alsobacter ponti]|uniref:metallophosphoesterase family protein n=1 Tax=Alsobacter ponti TaxID=2962936 RepID=UPI0027D97276
MIFVVGDLHGRADLLAAMLSEIETHAAGRPRRVIFLGDYIDRGPDSAGVLARVRALQAEDPDGVTCLMGNHEQMLLLARQDAAARAVWLDNGGVATLASFGAADVSDLPRDVVAWISGLPTFAEDDVRYYVHAGLDPDTPLERQSDADRLWIREPFIGSDHDFGKHVVHGHTPVRLAQGSAPLPDERDHRTNIDTGAVFGGALTAAVFTAGQVHPVGFIQVRDDGEALFFSSKRQVLALISRLSGPARADGLNALKPPMAPPPGVSEPAPSYGRIAASALILGLAGLGVAYATLSPG